MTTSEDADLREWREVELPKILAGECWAPATRANIDTEFSAYTGLEGLRGAFYLGAESYDCEGTIPNEYPRDDPKHKAFVAGSRAGAKIWGG